MEEFNFSEEQSIRKRVFFYLGVNTIIGGLLFWLLGNLQQTMAGTIFIALVIGTLVFWKFRVAIAFIGIVILLVTRTIDLEHTIDYMSLDVILFLIGMMVIMGVLRRSGFFRWLLAKGLERADFRPRRLVISFLILSAIMAALVDEVTSILFTTALVLDFSKFFKVKPVKLTICVVLATNIGSSWTVLGNPIGILIALRSGLTFGDFIATSLPLGLLALSAIVVMSLIWQRPELRAMQRHIDKANDSTRKTFIDELERLEDRSLFVGSATIFGMVLLLLALHNQLEIAIGLEHNTLLIGASLFGAGVAMLWQRNIARTVFMQDVDWWTLIFFMFLFAKAGALKYVGLTDLIGEALYNLAGNGDVVMLIILVLWISGIVSAAADNVVVVATFIPMLQYLGNGLESNSLWWALLVGGCYGGNMTMVGSTANIVALGILEDRANHHMTLKYWLRIGFIGTMIPMTIGTVGLILMYWLFGI